MKLMLELVPSVLALQSLQQLLTSKAWNTLRKHVLEEGNYQCAICGACAPPSLHCHEQWEYDDETHTQRLARLIILCPMCHHAKHMSSYNGYVTFEELVQHFMKVNECSLQEFDDYYQHCCEERTRREIRDDRGPVYWEQDYGEYISLLAREGNLKRRYEWENGDIVAVGLRKLRSHTD
jgi:hypothetical protein